MREVVRLIARPDATLEQLVDHFPIVVRAGRLGVSVHLCASDTLHLAPDPSREALSWLTLVDLSSYNPVKTGTGGLLTARVEPVDLRPSYVVLGEVTRLRSAEEIDAKEREEVARMETELRQLRGERLARARAARSGETLIGGAPDVAPARAPMPTLRTAAQAFATASAKAQEAFDASLPPTAEDEEDEQAVREMQVELRRLRDSRLALDRV
jgi:hypothetical protein